MVEGSDSLRNALRRAHRNPRWCAMATFIVAIGVVVLYAFATAVLWFEFRSREQRSIERVERATALILEAIGALRRDLAPVPGGGAPPPSSSGPVPPAPDRAPDLAARIAAPLSTFPETLPASTA